MTRRTTIIGAALMLIGAVLALAAWAYFSSGGGSSSTPVAIGTATAVPVNLTATTSQGGPLKPGDSATINVSIVNNSGSSVHLGSLSTSVSTGAAGCLASWFDHDAAALNAPLANGATTTAVLHVTFRDEPAIDESGCSGLSPTATVTLAG